MAYNFEYPYTDISRANSDWLLNRMKELESEFIEFVKLNRIKYANPIEWSIVNQYEKNTVVIDELTGDAYLSTQDVPKGVPLSDTDYWTPIFNYSVQLDKIREEIAEANEETSPTATEDRTVGELVWLNGNLVKIIADMSAGDSYVEGSNYEDTTIELELISLKEFIIDKLQDEADVREAKDIELEGAIEDEAEARETKDIEIDGEITDIKSDIEEINEFILKHRSKIIYIEPEETDCTEDIQNAFDTCEDGTAIILASGDYEVSDYMSLSNKNDVLFWVLGSIKPVGTLNNISKGIFFFSGCNNLDLSFKDIKNTTYNSTCNVIRLNACTNVYIHDSSIDMKQVGYDGGAGINIGANSEYISIERCFIRAQYGILVNDVAGVHDIRIHNNIFKGQRTYGNLSHGDAIEVNTPTYGANRIYITNNTASEYDYNATYARTLVFGFAFVSYITITGNNIFNTNCECLHFENGCSDTIISNNNFSDCFTGIMLTINSARSNTGFSISNNTIYTGAKSSASPLGDDYGYAICLNTGASATGVNTRVMIANNTCLGGANSSNGICLFSASIVSIIGNIVTNFSKDGISARPWGATVGTISTITIKSNVVNLCRNGIVLGSRTALTDARIIDYLIFKENVSSGSSNANYINHFTASNWYDVEAIKTGGANEVYAPADTVKVMYTTSFSPTDKTLYRCTVRGSWATGTFTALY